MNTTLTKKHPTHISPSGVRGLLGVIIVCLYPLFGYSQILPQNGNILEISSTLSGGEVSACQAIRLNPGFSFTANPGDSLILKIDQNICFGYTENEKTVLTSASPTQNYIITVTPLDETSYVSVSDGRIDIADDARALTTIQYFDGLGRPVQTVQQGFGPQGQDLVTALEYDNLGRERKNYLPVPFLGNGGAYIPAQMILPAAINAYNNDLKPYSETVYEPSPLNRVEKQFGPGNNWHSNDKSVQTKHFTNTADDSRLNCAYFYVSGYDLNKDGDYPNCQLFVIELKDEDGNLSYEFKNKIGQVILTRQINDNSNHDTYYVYDDYGNLRFVLPPMLSDILNQSGQTSWTTSEQALKDYAYMYRYNDLHLCIEKKLPGAESIKYLYDKADRLILTQDGALRAKNTDSWFFSIPDVFGRPVITGIMTASEASPGLATSIIASTSVTASYVGNNPDGISPLGYKINADGAYTITEFHTVNYYDNYMFTTLGNLNVDSLNYRTLSGYENTRYGSNSDPVSSKGLLTGSRTYILGEYSSVPISYYPSTFSVFYYDYRDRPIQSVVSNYYIGGYSREHTDYYFSGLPKRTRMEHTTSDTGIVPIYEDYTYIYDHAGRLTRTDYKLNGRAAVVQSALIYDDIGRIKTKKINNLSELDFSYQYNVRGWLTKISSPVFTESLTYEQLMYDAVPRYNGNISTVSITGEVGSSFYYTYRYDNLNRLTKGGFPGTYSFYETMTYDKNGNIKNLTRNENTNTLSYTYNGNQLQKVDDIPANYRNTQYDVYANYFVNGVSSSIEYLYDANGNMISDYNKGISKIQYNYLNLPSLVQMQQGHTAAYFYDALGLKIKEVNKTAKSGVNIPMTTTRPLNSAEVLSTEELYYIGNKVYRKYDGVMSLMKILTPEGYVSVSGNQYTHVGYVKDHLGSVQKVYPTANNNTPLVRYYPFGLSYYLSYAPIDFTERFNGKEPKTMFGQDFLDYGARMYDPAIGRWHVPDPLAEKGYHLSPYSYAFNNPINFIDPDGRWSFSSNDPNDIQKLLNWAKMNSSGDDKENDKENDKERKPNNPLNDLFKINIDPQNPKKTIKEIEQKKAILRELTEVVDFVSDALTSVHPLGSVLESVARFAVGDGKGALAAIPFALLDIATLGEGKLTQWGWKGSKIWRTLVNEVGMGGTIEKLSGKIPTEGEAKALIKEAKGIINRTDPPHAFPNPHNYNHINYTTPNGTKGTIQIQ